VLFRSNLFLDGIRRVLPRAFRAAVFGGLASVWPKDARLPRPLRLGNVLASAARDAFEGWAVDRTVWRPSSWRPALRGPYAEALKGFDPYAWPRALWKRLPAFATPLDRLLYLDRRTYLAEGVIAKVDRMSMAHSIEVRSPLLDHEIVGLSLRVADRDKFEGGVGKRLLRRLAAKTLPPEVVGAKKSGFAPPLAGWLRGPLRAVVAERLVRGPTLVGEMFDPAAVRALWESHQSGARNRARELWTLFALESWARRWR
jgi:asparagine synthase (glutamine-hydrolysing)